MSNTLRHNPFATEANRKRLLQVRAQTERREARRDGQYSAEVRAFLAPTRRVRKSRVAVCS